MHVFLFQDTYWVRVGVLFSIGVMVFIGSLLLFPPVLLKMSLNTMILYFGLLAMGMVYAVEKNMFNDIDTGSATVN